METAIQAAEDMSAANARTARSKLRDAIIIACAASILWVLLGLIVFRYVAGMTAEPLKELQSNMERMSQLEFEEVRFKKQSKIVEVIMSICLIIIQDCTVHSLLHCSSHSVPLGC